VLFEKPGYVSVNRPVRFSGGLEERIVVNLEKADGLVRGALLEDAFTGARLGIRAHVVVNATGPWSDAMHRLDEPGSVPLLRPTKGAHIAVPQKRIGNTGAVTLLSPIDGRVMFVMPWGDVTIVGTTDTDEVVVPDDVAANEQDVLYLVRSANAVFPNARLGMDDVIAAWAGLRPLLKGGGESTATVPRSRQCGVRAARWQAHHLPGDGGADRGRRGPAAADARRPPPAGPGPHRPRTASRRRGP